MSETKRDERWAGVRAHLKKMGDLDPAEGLPLGFWKGTYEIFIEVPYLNDLISIKYYWDPRMDPPIGYIMEKMVRELDEGFKQINPIVHDVWLISRCSPAGRIAAVTVSRELITCKRCKTIKVERANAWQ